MTGSIGIGAVGLGRTGRAHLAALHRAGYHYPDLTLRPRFVLAADPVAERADFAVERLGFEAATDDWHAVVTHPEVEAVTIAAPTYLRAEIGVAAAKHGKHVWVVEPAGRDAVDIAALADAVDAAGVRAAVGFDHRHAPAVAHIRELIHSGRLGRITHVHARFLDDSAADPRAARTWRFQAALAGSGALGEHMSHVVDLLHHLVGPIVEVSALTSTVVTARPLPSAGGTRFSAGPTAPVENEDYAGALLRFFGGAVGTAEASRIAVGPRRGLGVDVHGSAGAASWDFDRMGEVRVCLGIGGPTHGYTRVLTGPGHGDFAAFQPDAGVALGFDDLRVVAAALFLRSIAGGQDLAPDVTDALAVARVLDTMARAATSRRWERVI